MTNTADIGARLDEARLELLRRRLADRGLSSAAQDIGPHTDDRLSDGQARMWFVQMADPSGALLNICVSYRITGDIDLARLRDAKSTPSPVAIGYCVPPTLSATTESPSRPCTRIFAPAGHNTT